MSLPVQSPPQQPVSGRQPIPAHQAVSAKAVSKTGDTEKTEGDFSFLDFLDIVNPLQHIPIVSTIYRELTGDTIKAPARVLGGALFGGPVGAILGGINAVVASETGKDIGQLALSKVGLGSDDDAVETARADAKKNNIPVVEITPLPIQVMPLAQSPFAAVKSSDIVWDNAKPSVDVAVHAMGSVASNGALPAAKELNDLKPVAGFDPSFDEAVALNDIEPGSEPQKTADADIPAAPIDANQVPDQMAQALAKYKAMQDVSDKAVISPVVPDAAAKTRRPFAGLGQNIRHYAGN